MTTPQAREALYAAMRNTFGPDQADKLEMARREGERMDARIEALKGFNLGPMPVCRKSPDAEQAFWDEVLEDSQVDFEY